MRRGKLVVISAPSGCGKTTIAKEIMRLNPTLRFSVSATTRTKREGEKNGEDYYFQTIVEFKRKIAAGEFAEWEEVYPEQFYGTLRWEIERLLTDGHDILFDLDVKGGLSIKKLYPESCLIFISPPSFEALKDRLENRKTESEGTIRKRLDRVPLELEFGKQFDYQVVNDLLPKAVDEVQKIVAKHLQN